MRDWTISVLVNGAWINTGVLVHTTAGEAYKAATLAYPGVLVRVS
jgi:hypothetical protein